MKNKTIDLDIAKNIFIKKLSANFDYAFKLSGRAINNNVPCFIGSETHLKQIDRLAEEMAISFVEIYKGLKNENT